MTKQGLILLALSFSVSSQVWPNSIQIDNISNFYLSRPLITPYVRNGSTITYKQWISSINVKVDSIIFQPDCYSPIYIRSIKLKRGNEYYFTLDNFADLDSITQSWGATDNTILSFKDTLIAPNYFTYLKADTKGNMTYDNKPIFFNNLFWKVLDSTINIQGKDTAELTLWDPNSTSASNIKIFAENHNEYKLIRKNMYLSILNAADKCNIWFALYRIDGRYAVFCNGNENGFMQTAVNTSAMPSGIYAAKVSDARDAVAAPMVFIK
jgi:hypothetical protein